MSTINLVSSLMNHGKSLTKQLDKAKGKFELKNKAKLAENNIYDEVEKVITGLIKDLDELDDDEFTTKECFDKVVRKTMSSLQELKKHDDPQYVSGYEDLVTRVGKFRLSTNNNVSSTHGTSTPAYNNNVNDNEDNIDFNLDSYKNLGSDKQFLLDLFAMLPRGTNIKKNDLVLWWFVRSWNGTHLDPVKDDAQEESDFEKQLRELVEKKMIEPVVANVESVRKNNKREGAKYRMPNVIWSVLRLMITYIPPKKNVIWSKFQDSVENNEFAEITIKKKNSLSLSLSVAIKRSVVNTDACNLTTERLNMIKEHALWVLHLGNWNHDPKKYIVVEDVDSLSKVLNTSPLIFLSLEGVSGLVTLPSFHSEDLKVLNLKGCHNLESLPQFNTLIMRNLEYLDLSECYQLDHPANVVDGCIELRVVKGFVLPHQQDDPRNCFISNPSQFQHLWKLTLRTRRLSFPTNSDLETLYDLQSLTNLKITWVGACAPDNNQEVQFDVASKFPPKLTKFEMEAASESTSTKILDLIAQQKKTNVSIPLKKLYIKGGNLSKLNPEVDCKILRLHYLPKMEFDCYDMMKSFPELHRLEMSKDVMYSMLRRSFQKATGTNDQNSGWVPSLN